VLASNHTLLNGDTHYQGERIILLTWFSLNVNHVYSKSSFGL